MSYRRLVTLSIIVLDVVAVGILHLLLAVIVYVSNLTYGTWLPEFIWSYLTDSLLFWYIPAELLSIMVLGIFACPLQVLNVLGLIAAYRVWRGEEAAKWTLALLVLLVGMMEVAGLWLVRYYSQINGGDHDSGYALVKSRALFVLVLLAMNIWLLVVKNGSNPKSTESAIMFPQKR